MYTIVTLCLGPKFEPILPHWTQRIKEKCENYEICLCKSNNLHNINFSSYAWWDYIRMQTILELLGNNKTVVHCDIDVIIEKDLKPLVDLPFDIIISKEIGGENAFPKEYSNILGFGVCSGFFIAKPSALSFMQMLYLKMNDNANNKNSYSDQVALMEVLTSTSNIITKQTIILDGITYTNIIIELDCIKICVLDFNLVIRDPIKNNGQYANHINIDNVGGTEMFIKYFYNDFKDLPITCRCGKTWLGDYNVCPHLNQR